MLTAPLLLSVTPESYNSTKLIFSSVYDLSSDGISFTINSQDYAGATLQAFYPTFQSFYDVFSAVPGLVRRTLSKSNLSPAHVKWYDENNFEVVDCNYNSLDLNNAEYTRSVAKKIYSIQVVSSVNGVAVDTGTSPVVSGEAPTLPIMYNKTYRNAQDWITVPLVSGRKAIYVADALATPYAGDDSNNGLDPSAPKLTVSAAYNIMNPGDHLLFKRGSKWTNQAFGGNGTGLPSNLCADGKSGSSIDCPTYVGTYGDASAALPLFNITNSSISTFFLADNDDQYDGLKNFYIKCLHMTASGRDVREELNGDDFPEFLTILNTGGSAVATGASGDAITDNILVEGCRIEEAGNAITIQSYYNSLVPGVNGDYGWGTSNFVSSYTGPAAVTNVLIRRNIFKDLYFVPAGSISRANGLATFLQNVASNPLYNNPGEPGSLFRYNARLQTLVVQGRQPKAVYIYGASGQANIIEGNIFNRCGNKLETYPDSFDKYNATVLAEGGHGGVHVFRNIFYKCSNIAAMQLDGGANISNIYYRNPESVVMMGDVGLYQKKTYQGVPTSETFPSVSAGLSVKSSDGSFVPYWYWFNKNNGLSVIARNIIEEPQDVGYNAKYVSGEAVVLRRGATEQTGEVKSAGIKILGGTVEAYDNYIGNISKGLSTGLLAVLLRGHGRNVLHWNRGINSITHTQPEFALQNKINFRNNTINNHGTIFLHTHNYIGGFFNPNEPRSTDNLFAPSALSIVNNVIRNRFWNKNAPYNGNFSLQDAGVGAFTVYSDSNYADASRIVFTGNKIGINTGANTNRGFNIFGRLGQPYNGEYSINNVSSVIQSLFGTTTQERAATVSSNPTYLPQNLDSNLGDGAVGFLESYAVTSISEDNAITEWGTGRLENGWHKFEPYNYGLPNGTRIFYVDPNSNIPNPTGQHPSSPFRNLRSALNQVASGPRGIALQPGRPDWILLKRGTTFNFDEGTAGAPVAPGPTRRHTNDDGTVDIGVSLQGIRGISKEYPFIIGAYGSDADPAVGNWFGNSTEARPLLTRKMNGPVPGRTIGGFFHFRGPEVQPENPDWFSRYVVVQDLHLAGLNWTTPTLENNYCRSAEYWNGNPMILLGWYAGQTSSYLFEGCLLENWHHDQINVFTSNNIIPDVLKTVPQATALNWNCCPTRIFDRNAHQDINFRRCAVYKTYAHHSYIRDGRSQNAYMDGCKNINFIESVLDGGGVNPEIRRTRLDQAGQGSVWSHNLYYSYKTRDMGLIRSINARSSSHGVQFRGGGRVLENLFIKNPIVGLVNSCESDGNVNSVTCRAIGFDQLNSKINKNVFLDSTIIGGGSGGERGWGLQSINGSSVTIEDNIFAKTNHDPQNIFNNPFGTQNTFAIDTNATWIFGNTPPDCLGSSSMSIINNIIYKWQIPNGGGLAINLHNADQLPNFTMRGNKITFSPVINSGSNATVSVRVQGGPTPATLSTWNVGSNNYGSGIITWCSQNIPFLSGCFTCSSQTNTLTNSPTNFVPPRYWGDDTSVYTQEEYPNPEVTIVDYVNKVATEFIPSNVDKLDYFLVKARNNRKGAWDKRWTALEAINFFRINFGKAPLGSMSSVDQFMTKVMDNITCNNSSIETKLLPQVIVNDNILGLTQINIPTNTPIYLPDTPAGGGGGTAPSPEDSDPNYYGADAELTLYNPTAQAINVVLDPEDPNSLTRIPARKSIRIPYVERNEALEQVVQRWNLATMIKYNNLVFRAFGSIPLPSKAIEALETPTLPPVENTITVLDEPQDPPVILPEI